MLFFLFAPAASWLVELACLPALCSDAGLSVVRRSPSLPSELAESSSLLASSVARGSVTSAEALLPWLVETTGSTASLLPADATGEPTLRESDSADDDSAALFFFRRFIRGGEIFIAAVVAPEEDSSAPISDDWAALLGRARRGGTETDRHDVIEFEPTPPTGNTSSSSSSGVGQRALGVDSPPPPPPPGRSADGSGGPVSVLDFRSRSFPAPRTPTATGVGGGAQLVGGGGATTAGRGVDDDDDDLPNVRNVQVSRVRRSSPQTSSSTSDTERR